MKLLVRTTVSLVLTALVGAPGCGPKTRTPATVPTASFPSVAFMERLDTAWWLLRYDAVAWHTSDLVMEAPEEVLDRLSSVWFCLEHDGKWHALYGRFDAADDAYVAVLHYAESEGDFVLSDEALPPSEVNDLARALYISWKRLEELLPDPGARFNTYVRRLQGGDIEVWALPAWQPNGELGFGSSFRALLDFEGRQILEEDAPSGAPSKGTPSRESNWIIPNESVDLPSVGDIFTTMLVARVAALAGVRCREFTSLYVDLSGKGDFRWVHVHRDQDLEESVETMRRLFADGRLE